MTFHSGDDEPDSLNLLARQGIQKNLVNEYATGIPSMMVALGCAHGWGGGNDCTVTLASDRGLFLHFRLYAWLPQTPGFCEPRAVDVTLGEMNACDTRCVPASLARHVTETVCVSPCSTQAASCAGQTPTCMCLCWLLSAVP